MEKDFITELENRKSLKALYNQLIETTENSKHICFEQACMIFGVDLEEIDSTDNTYKANLIDDLPLSIKVDYINGLRPFKKLEIAGFKSCKYCGFNITRMISGYAINPKTKVKIATKKPCIECKASSHEKFFNGCFGDVTAIFGYPEPRITKPVITTSEQIAYKFEVSRRDGLRLERAFKALNLDFKTQESLRKEYFGRIPELYKVLKDLAKELLSVEAIKAEDAFNFISSSYYEDESLESSDPDLWYESELERVEEIGASPASYDAGTENAYTYNKFNFGALQHHADIVRNQKSIKKAIDSARNQQQLKDIVSQVAPIMREAWTNYKNKSFDLLCDRFSNDLISAIRAIRHSETKKAWYKNQLIRLKYNDKFSIGEAFPIWLTPNNQATLWRHIKQPLIRLETI